MSKFSLNLSQMTTLPQCSFVEIPQYESSPVIPINQHTHTLEPFNFHGTVRMLTRREIKMMQAWLNLMKELTGFKQVQKLYPQVSQLVFSGGCPKPLWNN
jgi:hypothetical protein